PRLRVTDLNRNFLLCPYRNFSRCCDRQTCCGSTQPLILLNSSLGRAAATTFYLQPVQSEVAQNQFYKSEMMKVYADQLSVGFGWSGGTPSQLASNVAISGHLVDIATGE